MEKRTPQYNLGEVKLIVANRRATAFTRTAIENGRLMGLTTDEMVEVVRSMSGSNFYKSMTTYHDHTEWQDVYHALTPHGKVAYIKVSNPHRNVPVIQFKEK